MSYEEVPLDPGEILLELDAREWLPPVGIDSALGEDAGSDAATPAQLAAFAVEHNPTLRAARAEIGLSEALTVQARLFPEMELGWSASDALAGAILNGTVTDGEILAGFQVLFPIPRPGERDARGDAAEWRLAEARWRVATAEWRLARAVYVAAEENLGAARLAALGDALVEISNRTRTTFQRARETGAATSIQHNLATGELRAVQLRSVQLGQQLQRARLRLNALLGLPPQTVVPLRSTSHELLPAPPVESPDELVELALERRPDLGELMASYQAAEQGVRYEIARQWPELTIGTGIFIVPQLFNRGNRPAIRAAMERRERLGREVTARLHEIRAEVHAAWTLHEQSLRVVEFLEEESLPNAEEGLRLAGAALGAGGATLIEILALQRNLTDVRVQHVEAQVELARNTRILLASSGMLPDGTDRIAPDEVLAPKEQP